MNNIILIQFIILLCGTLFAWFNFGKEFMDWRKNKTCAEGCVKGANPFLTPCFYGAIFFTTAFILSLVLLMNY